MVQSEERPSILKRPPQPEIFLAADFGQVVNELVKCVSSDCSVAGRMHHTLARANRPKIGLDIDVQPNQVRTMLSALATVSTTNDICGVRSAHGSWTRQIHSRLKGAAKYFIAQK